MRRAIVATVVALAFAGCGSETRTVTVTTAASAPAPTTTTALGSTSRAATIPRRSKWCLSGSGVTHTTPGIAPLCVPDSPTSYADCVAAGKSRLYDPGGENTLDWVDGRCEDTGHMVASWWAVTCTSAAIAQHGICYPKDEIPVSQGGTYRPPTTTQTTSMPTQTTAAACPQNEVRTSEGCQRIKPNCLPGSNDVNSDICEPDSVTSYQDCVAAAKSQRQTGPDYANTLVWHGGQCEETFDPVPPWWNR